MEGIRTVAFLSPENKTVLQVLNSTDQNKDVKIRFDNRQVGLTILAGSINTVIWKNINN
jgi:O-glycosyl hydrolase